MFSFYEVFKECRKSVLSSQFQSAVQKWFSRPPLDSFGSVKELLAFLNKRFNHACLGEVRRRDAVLKRLLQIHQDNCARPGLEALFLLIFQPALQKLFRQYRWVDSEGEDLGQIIFSSFLGVLRNPSLRKRSWKIALNIVLDTKHKVSAWVSVQSKRDQVELLDDEELPKIEQPHTGSPEDGLITLIDLAHNVGRDEDTNRICTRIDHLYEKGIIDDIEKKILVGRLVYREALRKLVPLEDYEKWKKKMQRLMKKIYAD